MDYSKKTIAQLREIAKNWGIRNIAGLKKQELVELVQSVELMMAERREQGNAQTGEQANSRQSRSQAREEGTRKTPVRRERRESSQSERPGRTEKTERLEKNEKPEKTERQDRTEKPADAQSAEAKEDKTEKSEKGQVYDGQEYNPQLDEGDRANGILEVMAEGFGFIRSDNYMPGEKDIYVSPAQIRKFGLKTGDIIVGPVRKRMQPNEKFQALLYIETVNGLVPSEIVKRKTFEALTPIFPDDRIRLDYNGAPVSLRIVDLFSPIGKGQRGMIVSPPKAGKTTLLKQIARRISVAYPDIHLLVLLIDERPEEVTDIKESIVAKNAEVIYSTFDELPEHHKRVSEMVIERAKRMVESGMDVVILLDSLTRLARAYNLTVTPSGRTLSGGLDPAALHMPKKFFGAARNMREGGSLTILATALIETGSRMDDVVFEEFKGTGNMELVLNRSLSERRVFPAIDIAKSGTRRDDLLLSNDEREVLDLLHQQLRGAKAEEATEEIIKLFGRTRNNMEFLDFARKMFSRNIR
ncbi:MAG: transcription termination factor Rho [Eubacterium sp.]|nr:transcription termination factor Rho [Eubacterium sp.]